MIRAITGTKDGVRRVYLDVDAPQKALEALDRLLQTEVIHPNEYNYAELCDNGSEEFKPDAPNCYPLKFKSEDRTEELWVSGVSSGKRNAKSEAALQILLLMGFNVSGEQDVYCLAKGMKKIFHKRR